MIEEPYRWLEAIANRREYVREQLREGAPVFAASLPAGVLMVGVGVGHSKVFELFDRHALAGLGHPADLEKVRQSAIDAAHLEAFSRAPEDVSLRRLVGFGLGPQLKASFEQVFSAPFLVELILAEVGSTPGEDLLARVHFDGAFQLQAGGVMVAAADREVEAAATAWVGNELGGEAAPGRVVDVLLQAWWMTLEKRSFTEAVPSAEARSAGWRKALEGRRLEAAWLERGVKRRVRYRAIGLADVGL